MTAKEQMSAMRAAAWEVKDADGTVSFAQKLTHAEPFANAPGFTVRPLIYGDTAAPTGARTNRVSIRVGDNESTAFDVVDGCVAIDPSDFLAIADALRPAEAGALTVAATVTRCDEGEEVGEHRIELHKAFDQALDALPAGTTVWLYARQRASNTSRLDPSWSLHDRVEFALRDAGFDYGEASCIAVMAANGTGGAVAPADVDTLGSVRDYLERSGYKHWLAAFDRALAGLSNSTAEGAYREVVRLVFGPSGRPRSAVASAAEPASLLDRLDNVLSAYADSIPGAVYDELETVVNTLKQAENVLAAGHQADYKQPTHAEAITALHMAIGALGGAHGLYIDKGVPEIITAQVLAYFKPAAESLPPSAEIRWTCSDTDEVYRGGNYDSELAAIAGALDKYPDAQTIYIGKIKPMDIRRLIRGDHLIEAIGERAYDEVGEVAEHWPELSEEDVAELEGIVAGFVLGKAPVTFFTVEGERSLTRQEAETIVVANTEGQG